jgi:arsenate reductase
MKKETKRKVLFICTHNSARSQMAEGILRYMYGNKYSAYSAGTEPTYVHQNAIKVMREINIDISKQKAKSVDIYKNKSFDYVITVCDHAQETYPFFPGGKKIIHKSFEDPVKPHDSHLNNLAKFRKVRNNISIWIQHFFGMEQ